MRFLVECSYGEIVDKITILKIKLEKVKDDTQRMNIQKEYDSLQKYMKQDDDQFDSYFNDLYVTNKKLWDLEDMIREKSKKKVFDEEYINCAENIHITNDYRYSIKKQINDTYDSEIKEEKIYNKDNDMPEKNEKQDSSPPLEKVTNETENTSAPNQVLEKINNYDSFLINQAINSYESGEYIKSFYILDAICDKYAHSPVSEPIIQLYFCYETACDVINIKNKYQHKLDEYKDVFPVYFKDEKLLHNVKKRYAFVLLKNKKYEECYEYLQYLQPVYANGVNLNINPDNTGYFQEGDKDKTLLIYTSGGIGDKIMYFRFIRRICEINPENNILFLIDDGLFWIYEHVYKDIPNIQIVKYSERNSLPHYDYHINTNMLFKYLNLTYDTLYVDYYLTDLPNHVFDISNIIDSSKKNIIINWHGNIANTHEKYNRGMDIKALIPLFEKLTNINWICVQKEVSENESMILKKYNVKNLSKKIDNDGDIYKDTLHILKMVDLVISTDTSLIHVAATANIKCWALLTLGCEWRWTRDKSTMWYPKVKLLRQKQLGNWDSVIDNVVKALTIITGNKTQTQTQVVG
jgi:ADP-heptose:LPS heptosyltransferase